jgi:repressor of nif and glnA expression
MSDQGKKHRVIGIRHVLRHLKNAGLVEKDALYAREAVADVQDEVLSRAIAWYKIGAKRGALEVLEAFLNGNFRVRKRDDGSREIIAKIAAVEWHKKLKARVGSNSRTVKETTYKLTTKELGFE